MQDRAVADIGKMYLESLSDAQPHRLYIQNMFPGRNYGMVLIIITRDEQGQLSFEGVDIENVNDENYHKYAYRKGSARGGDITFTTKFGDIDKKLKTILSIQFDSLIELAKVREIETDYRFFTQLKAYFKENYDLIKTRLVDIYNQLDKKTQQTTGLSFKFIDASGDVSYLEDFQVIRKKIELNGTEDKAVKYNVSSLGHNEQCSICFEKKEQLYGFASPFKYATVDKPGMVSGFFEQKSNWKNYPICADCALEFEMGKNYILQNLNKYFYGKYYYAIPKPILPGDHQSLQKAVKLFERLNYEIDQASEIEHKEDFLLRLIGREENYFSLNLLFYEENPTTKAIKIKLLLEEILPSRFNELFVTIPDKINPHPLYKNAISIKKKQIDLKFNFGTLHQFFKDEFYETIQKVFIGMPISRDLLFSRIMKLIRENYNKIQTSDSFVEPIHWTVLKAHMVINYLQELKIISYNENYKMMETENAPKEKKGKFDEEKFKDFLQSNSSFLDEDYKIGIFSIGILVRLLLNIQHANLGNTPFEKKLKGYHLNPELLKSIYLEALEKISQYQSFFAYANLREYINQYFTLQSADLKKISNNELSFYFVAGLEMGNRFRTEKISEAGETTN